MFERNLLFRELAAVNGEFEFAGTERFVDVSLDTPNTIIEQAAVKPFSAEDRKLLYTRVLPLKRTFVTTRKGKVEKPSLEKATKKNAALVGTKKKPQPGDKIFGVDLPVFLDRLAKYVDFQEIEQALRQNHPSLVIDRQNPLNELVTEAVHQFQAKTYTHDGDWDGIIGASVISSLGFVFHERKNFKSADANEKIRRKFKEIDQHVRDYVAGLSIALPDINGDTWFGFIINPSLFGWRGKQGFGFHLLLVLKLRETENDLYAPLGAELKSLFDRDVFKPELHGTRNLKGATYGRVPRLLGKALGINEHHSDVRKVSPTTPLSYHLSGVAIDINYKTNPWIKGTVGLNLINQALRAAKKPVINIKGVSTVQTLFTHLAQNNSTADLFDRLKELSDDCRQHLPRKNINWGVSERSTNEGFLNLRKELVVGLRDRSGLAWGAVDFGNGRDGNGDVMHFDMRTSAFGQAYSEKVGNGGVNDHLEKVHRHFRRVVYPPPPKKRAAKPAAKNKESAPVFERNLLVREIESVAPDFEAPPAGVATRAYDGLNLLLKDSDGKRIFEGQKRADVTGNPVRQLQTDLKSVGIEIGGAASGEFDFATECAVREFQIYAKMPRLAQPAQGFFARTFLKLRNAQGAPKYGDDFRAIDNPDKYTGEVNGVLNGEVRRLLQKWLANSWRIPVIVQAWTMKKNRREKIFAGKDNIWKFDEVKSSAPRMFVKDLSGYYTFPATRDPQELIVLGDYSKYGSWGGPRSEGASRSWSETEITPESLLGKALTALSTSERSTFMVIRAVSQVECEGHLDRMNAYDNAFVSFGPFHWVLGLANISKVTDGGEISSYIAYLKEKDKAAYDRAFGFFGLDAQTGWNRSGQDFFYSGGIRNYGKGLPTIKRGSQSVSLPKDRSGLEFGNYLRSWHWFYRFVMAARTVLGFTRYIWDFARLRIRDVGAINVRISGLDFTDSAGKSKTPTLAELFTSERAFALVLRLHVRYPSHVANLNSASQTTGLRTILVNSIAQMKTEKLESKDFSKWGQRHQEILIANFIAHYPASKGIRTTLETVRDFTFRGRALSTAANSFEFNRDNLPPAPNY